MRILDFLDFSWFRKKKRQKFTEQVTAEYSLPKDIEMMRVDKYNEARLESDSIIRKFQRGLLILLCNKCGNPVRDQDHRDYRGEFPMRQVVCINPYCGESSYRRE